MVYRNCILEQKADILGILFWAIFLQKKQVDLMFLAFLNTMSTIILTRL